MNFDLRFYPNGIKEPTVSICVEADDPSRLKKLSHQVDSFWDEFEYMGASALGYDDIPDDDSYSGSASGRVIYECDWFQRERKSFLNEQDALSLVFYSIQIFDTLNDSDEKIENDNDNANKRDCLEGLTVSMTYYGDKYEKITNFVPIRGRLGICGVKFVARNYDEESATYYLLTKTVLSENYPKFEDHSIKQSPSFGIVKTHPNLHYAGDILSFEEVPGTFRNADISYTSVERKDEDDNLITELAVDDKLYHSNIDYSVYDVKEVFVAHLFFERNREDYAFSMLMNGKLCKMISKTDNAVIFHSLDNRDIVFRITNGIYLNDKCSLAGPSFNIATNTAITIPPIPKIPGDDISGANVLRIFFLDCVKTLYKAFENSETYFTTKYQWLSFGESIDEWSEKTKNNFATDNPPACQIDIKRADNYIYAFRYEGIVITARASVPCDNMKDLKAIFRIPFPDFSVDSVAFNENGSTIVLKPQNNVLDVKITDAETKESFEGKFGLLRMQPDFDNTDIPLNLYLDPDWLKVKNQLNLYKKIKDAIIKYGVENCKSLLDNEDIRRKETITKILYGSEGMVPDDNVISMAFHLKNEYNRTKKIPNIAIEGQAGTGKTTLAKNLGKIFGKDILAITPSDLRGAYIGHTKFEVVQKLAEAAEHDQILYLDEAYQLMDDKFGQEAITVLLPLMTGDQTKVEASLDKGQGDIIELDFGDAQTGRKGHLKITNTKHGKIKKDMDLEPGTVPIWISGYENEVRMMISQNQGLYRRLKPIVIKAPVTSDLVKQFIQELERFTKNHDKVSRKAKMLKKHFKDNGIESVKNFFAWGSEPQNSKYFASHAGVSNFAANCIDSIDFSKDLGFQIEDIIISTKLEIKRQLSTIRAGSKNSPYHDAPDAIDTIPVITDIDTRFKDLVGCESQIAYMNSIIEMLVNKSSYEDYRLTVPKGALMEGLPGTGKTFIARAMAGELQEHFQKKAPDKRFGFMSFSASELGNKPASYIASIFNVAEEFDACILFIDEVDAIAAHRNDNHFRDRYLELIKQMDGIEKRSNVFILAATNAPENLDPAFVRSGRIDKNLVFTLPDKKAREELVRRAIKKRLKTLVNFNSKDKEEDIDSVAKLIAKRTWGFTAGDIDNVINSAFITHHQFTHRNDPGSPIGKDSFKSYPFIKHDQRDRVEVMSKEVTKDKSLNDIYAFIAEEIERKIAGAPNYRKREEKFNTNKNGNCSSTAIHEVGHAVLSLMLGEKPFDIITTIPRGDALGYVSHSELDLITKSDYENRIRVCMGGRIAEEIVYGKNNISTGAVTDMRNATNTARHMIEIWGFSDEFGFMSLSTPVWKYLGGSNSYTCSDAFREKSDIAVNALLKKMYDETFKMLEDQRELIETLSKRVFDSETMTGEEFKKLYEKERKKKGKRIRKRIRNCSNTNNRSDQKVADQM